MYFKKITLNYLFISLFWRKWPPITLLADSSCNKQPSYKYALTEELCFFFSLFSKYKINSLILLCETLNLSALVSMDVKKSTLYFETRKLRTLWLSSCLMRSRGDVWPVTFGLTGDGDS